MKEAKKVIIPFDKLNFKEQKDILNACPEGIDIKRIIIEYYENDNKSETK